MFNRYLLLISEFENKWEISNTQGYIPFVTRVSSFDLVGLVYISYVWIPGPKIESLPIVKILYCLNGRSLWLTYAYFYMIVGFLLLNSESDSIMKEQFNLCLFAFSFYTETQNYEKEQWVLLILLCVCVLMELIWSAETETRNVFWLAH